MPKVSVIVPVYGVEKYIERCARSLFEQTLDDMEFIFVDDCTPDSSIEVLERVLEIYPYRKKQTKIIHHKKNEGLPAARHTGLLSATGTFIAHCDSDDWVDLRLYETMYNTAVEQSSDIVVCNIKLTDSNKTINLVKTIRYKKIEGFLESCLLQKNSWSLCNKLISLNIYKSVDLVYPKMAMGEDLVLTTQLLLNCKEISFIESACYNYYVNNNSVSRKISKESVLKRYHDYKANVETVLQLLKSSNNCNRLKHGVLNLKYTVRSMLMVLCRDNKYYNIWRSSYPEIMWPFLLSHKIKLYHKVYFTLTLLRLLPLNKHAVS